jgi:hypothetical protein
MAKKKITLETLAAGVAKMDARMEKGFASIDARVDKGFAAVADDIADIRERMATKDDINALEKILTDQIAGLDGKVAGINRRLDTEAMQRSDLKVPRRVHDLEEEVYGPGRSKHPKQVPL